MREKNVRFASGKLSLEGVLYLPEGGNKIPLVIVCHPHPLYGGSMENNVVDSLCLALVQASCGAFKFNFRGVGGSEGEYGEGIGEQEDVRASLDFVTGQDEVDSSCLGVAGYSAGAGFSIPVGIGDERVKALAAVSPPLGMYDFSSLKDCLKPKMLIAGERDNLIPQEQFHQFCEEVTEPKECINVADADHFWWGYEGFMAQKVAEFFTVHLRVS
ncbi:alpha/beta hydrolase [Chloroflexota bacterium]